jgi:hypothetical protein
MDGAVLDVGVKEAKAADVCWCALVVVQSS